MSNRHKSKQYDFIDMFNDTSRYLYEIFTIDNPEGEKDIPDIQYMQRNFSWTKQILQTKKLLSLV